MEFIKLTKGKSAITIFNNLGFFKLSTDGGGEEDLTPTASLVYTLSSNGAYYIVGTGFTSIEAIEADTSGGTAGSGLDSTWSGGQLVIPAEYNGKPVKAIAPKSFNAVKNITEAYISDGITCIGHRAFQCSEADGFDTTMVACRLPETLTSLGGTTTSSAGRVLWGRKGLEAVNLPSEITILPTSTFAYCGIKNIILPDNINELSNHIFQYCENLESVDLGNVEKCQNQIFSNCTNLKTVNINKELQVQYIYMFTNTPKLQKGNIRLRYVGTSNNIAHNETFMNFGSSVASGESEVDLYLNSNITMGLGINYQYMFNNAKLRKVVFGDGYTKIGSLSNSFASFMFKSANIEEVRFEKATEINGYTDKESSVFARAIIKKLYFPLVTMFWGAYLFYGGNINLLLGQENCILQQPTYFNTSNVKKFVKHTAIDFYSQTTNWVSLFTNNGSEEQQMFVWNEFTNGDTLPTQIGTTQVYNVTWYEDIDFTTQAGSTATETKEYYGKISAVV